MALAASGGPGRGPLGLLRLGGCLLRLTLVALPNGLTLLRLAASVPVAFLLWHDDFGPAFVLLLVAALSDGVDGPLARLANACTPLGAALDPVADKLLLASVLVGVLDEGVIPVWLAVLILGRDAVLVLGAAAFFCKRDLPVAPLALGKLTAAAQMGYGLVAVAALSGDPYAAPALNVAVPAVGALTFCSLLAYLHLYLGRFRAA
ncbi:MAG: CDP-alcohol phosphatidyltransferase family protein [Geminicoccaceae bacterium]|nr:CDP-alcohol phosphatidyltransferase family protein [Geminicoccaceae bacterium]